jgi:uncharacterized protein with LGFP repeats
MRHALRLLAVLTVLAASLMAPVATSTPAQQADAADLRLFDPGNIISDAVFFDGLAMDAGQIQTFLNDKGSACRVGTDGTPCLKNYSMETFSRSADGLCNGYQGARLESAATIIAKVAASCRISPRVLLVLLEKEMGLVRTTAPTAKKFDRAAGYACPDNVGGWCNPDFAGLQNQLYKSGWQYQRYAANASSYSYRAGRNNVVQWHPNAGCGTSVVYIQNQATAGLYNYTPYRPNQRALDAGYGTGDSCSSYGNRNFWNFFTDWFGSTQSAGAGAIQVRHNELGGSAGWLGAPTTGFQCGLRDYGCFQGYQNGSIYWTPATGARPVTVPIRDKWALTGWELGSLGYPAADPICGLTRNGCFQVFQGGSIYWSPATGAHFVKGSIRDLWGAVGWELGALGYPTSDENCGLKDGGCFTHFERGSIYWSPFTGARLIWPEIRAKYEALGWENGTLGYPVVNPVCGLAGGGCYQPFQGGNVYWSPASGAWLPSGPIRDLWGAIGWETGSLGYPTSDVRCGLRDGGCSEDFQGGTVFWSSASGAHLVWPVLREKYVALGATRGILGYPVTNPVCGLTGGGCYQPFQGGALYWSPTTGTWFVRGAIAGLWNVLGSEYGLLGYPTTDENCGLPGNGCYQLYQNGSIYWSPATGEHFVNGAIRDAWAAVGWEAGAWGYPTANPMAVDGGLSQRFQNGTARWNASTGAVTFG